MKTTYLSMLAVGSLTASGAYAANGSTCDTRLSVSLQQAQHVVGSLHADKPSQMRVFAIDGSEFTAGQGQWMKGQLQRVSQACAEGDAADAGARLGAVQQLLSERRRTS
jgi:Ni/Co efflux regulator RcnB